MHFQFSGFVWTSDNSFNGLEPLWIYVDLLWRIAWVSDEFQSWKGQIGMKAGQYSGRNALIR